MGSNDDEFVPPPDEDPQPHHNEFIRDIDRTTGEFIPDPAWEPLTAKRNFKNGKRLGFMRGPTKPAPRPTPVQVTPTRKHLACKQYGYDLGCIVPGCTRNTILHHFITRSNGGPDHWRNRICICKKHEEPLHIAGLISKYMQDGKPISERLQHSLSKMKNFRPQWLQTERMVPTHNPVRDQVTIDVFTEKPTHRRIIEVYHLGHIRDVYADNMELVPNGKAVPIPIPPAKLSKKQKAKRARQEREKRLMDEAFKVSHVAKTARKELSMEEEHAEFQRYQNVRHRTHGKKSYTYGKQMATNLAAPMIKKLRDQVAREGLTLGA